MRQLKTFFYSFRRSLADPEYYSHILKTPFSFSFKYIFFLVFLFIFARAFTVSLSLINFIPKLPQYVSQGKQIVKEFYPHELVLTFRDGALRTNVDEPYTIPFPKSLNVQDTSFAVIDTKSSIDNMKNYKTVLYVTKDAVAYPDNNADSGYKVRFFSDFRGYTVINRASYDRVINQLLPYFDYAPHLFIGLSFFVLLFLTVFGTFVYLPILLIQLLVLSVIIYLISKGMKKNLGYWEIYRLSLHGVTFSVLFDYFKNVFGISIPYTFVMPYLIWMTIVLSRLRNVHETNTVSQQPPQPGVVQ